MCMMIGQPSLCAWLEGQERMMRAWLAEAALQPDADLGQLERLEAHCAWLAEERGQLVSRIGDYGTGP